VFGGAIFLVCIALGLGALFFPLDVRLPRPFLVVFAASPVLAGVGLLGPVTPRWGGALLLAAFVAALGYLVRASRGQQFLRSHEVDEAAEERRSPATALGLTVLGLAVIGVGGELVAQGAQRIVARLGVPALLMGMIVTPAAIELEEVIRQAVPAREGRPDVSAGNLVGTLLNFVLFNLGLIALLTPVRVDALVRQVDWPFLIAITWVATIFLWQGRVGRVAGLLLLAAYAGYIALHVVLR
jgi:cation:H+ antiporter